MSIKLLGYASLLFLLGSLLMSCNRTTVPKLFNEDQVAGSNAQYSNSMLIQESPEILARLNRIFPIKGTTALEVAKEKLKISQEEAKSLILCDGGIAWRVVSLTENKEVWVAKSSGEVFAPPFSISKNVDDLTRGQQSPADKREAIEIAKKHFIDYGRKKFNSDESVILGTFASVCDLNQYWRIYFLSDELRKIEKPSDIKNLPNDHPPDYIVDKQSGEIIYFNFASGK